MQPTIICTAPIPGMIYMNGRFAGEASAERPLYAPISPYGAAYIEYRPLAAGYDMLARKCVFSGGALLPDSVADADGMSVVAWPGAIFEIEFTPPRHLLESFFLENTPCTLSWGDGAFLDVGGLRLSLPEAAQRPLLKRIHNCPLLLGDIQGGGQYLLTLTPDFTAQTGYLAADRIDFDGKDMLHAIIASGDTVGHSRLEQWIVDTTGLQRVSSEPIWSHGAPQWPQTAEDTMRAAVEAMLAGQYAESDGYFAQALAVNSPLNAITDLCDLCVPMKYGLPASRPCVGLLRAENLHLASVRPLYYRAALTGGMQGPWQIDWISLE